MAKISVKYIEEWPFMEPLGKKEALSLGRHLHPDEKVLGQVIGSFNQLLVATDRKVMIIKSGLMSGQTFGVKETSFDYRLIVGVEVKAGPLQGELQIISAGFTGSQGNRNRDKVKMAEEPNGLVFGSSELKHFSVMANKIRETAGNLAAPTPTTVTNEPKHTIPEQILALSELHKAGIISEDEFQNKKSELLGRM